LSEGQRKIGETVNYSDAFLAIADARRNLSQLAAAGSSTDLIDAVHLTLDDADKRIMELEARIAALEEALRPFAEAWSSHGGAKINKPYKIHCERACEALHGAAQPEHETINPWGDQPSEEFIADLRDQEETDDRRLANLLRRRRNAMKCKCHYDSFDYQCCHGLQQTASARLAVVREILRLDAMIAAERKRRGEG
jgi:hypothetical protein